ncbi:MAG: DUF892 family protein [Bacteroidia bacterium]|nr:DUF892 family protein [Bacteroidia bacterium]
MKPVISNLTEAVAYVLADVYTAEALLKGAIPDCQAYLTSPSLKAALSQYANRADDKRNKVLRVFNYLLREPDLRSNLIVEAFVDKTKNVLQQASSPEMRDIMLATCFQSVNYYLLANYRAVARMVRELELETAGALLDQVIAWDEQTAEQLARIATYELNGRSPEYQTKS